MTKLSFNSASFIPARTQAHALLVFSAFCTFCRVVSKQATSVSKSWSSVIPLNSGMSGELTNLFAFSNPWNSARVSSLQQFPRVSFNGTKEVVVLLSLPCLVARHSVLLMLSAVGCRLSMSLLCRLDFGFVPPVLCDAMTASVTSIPIKVQYLCHSSLSTIALFATIDYYPHKAYSYT